MSATYTCPHGHQYVAPTGTSLACPMCAGGDRQRWTLIVDVPADVSPSDLIERLEEEPGVTFVEWHGEDLLTRDEADQPVEEDDRRWTLIPSMNRRMKGYPMVTDGPLLDEAVEVVPRALAARPDPADAEQAAFVRAWLIAWADEYVGPEIELLGDHLDDRRTLDDAADLIRPRRSRATEPEQENR